MISVPRPSPRRTPLLVGLLVVALVTLAVLMWPRGVSQTIGVEGRHVLDLGGELLTAIPFTPGDPLAVRVDSVESSWRGHRYDLRTMAFRPGTFDVSDYLVDSTGRRPANLPNWSITVGSVLPSDHRGELFDTPTLPIDLQTPYRAWMTLAWSAWLLLLIPLALQRHRRRRRMASEPTQPSAEERLRTLLDRATTHELNAAEQVDLEKLLLQYWSQQLHVTSERLIDTLEVLRQHPAAAKQVRSVERWLHARHALLDADVARELLGALDAAQASAATMGESR